MLIELPWGTDWINPTLVGAVNFTTHTDLNRSFESFDYNITIVNQRGEPLVTKKFKNLKEEDVKALAEAAAEQISKQTAYSIYRAPSTDPSNGT